jgi:excinuclease ABC subunit B
MREIDFKLVSEFEPMGDQPEAIKYLSNGLRKNKPYQTLLGATGTGKTFAMANIVQKTQKPTLVLTHNKTLAAQLCSEFQSFFPENAVSYFVSYYDYYQPEAYLPRSDTFIEKEATINEEIEKFRFAATNNLLTRTDTLVVATVSCIYGIGSPKDFLDLAIEIKVGDQIKRDALLRKLTDIQYTRSHNDFKQGMFHVLGDTVEIFPPESDTVIRLEMFGDEIDKITEVADFTGEFIADLDEVLIFPAKHAVTTRAKIEKAAKEIQKDLKLRFDELKKMGKNIEAERVKTRTEFDLEMLLETGHVPGIENYTRYFSGRAPGQPPSCLLEFFPEDFICFIDESHIAVPQIGAMYEGDRSRKTTLVEHGFRLPSALDNRPLKFEEFEPMTPRKIMVSATPGQYEFAKCAGVKKEDYYAERRENPNLKLPKNFTEQIIRPTGLTDPVIEIKPTKHQIDLALEEVQKRILKGERVLITTLTKKSAERLAEFMKENGINTGWLHSEVDTLERIEILRSLREGKIDVLVGINLLREGLDLPEVSLVLILDADKQGFLRSRDSLIQTIGRASRNVHGKAILFADRETVAMKDAILETSRRREIQIAHNKKHGITPKTIIKKIQDIAPRKREEHYDKKKIKKDDLPRLIKELEDKMNLAAQNMEFEKAAELRDEIDFLQASK